MHRSCLFCCEWEQVKDDVSDQSLDHSSSHRRRQQATSWKCVKGERNRVNAFTVHQEWDIAVTFPATEILPQKPWCSSTHGNRYSKVVLVHKSKHHTCHLTITDVKIANKEGVKGTLGIHPFLMLCFLLVLHIHVTLKCVISNSANARSSNHYQSCCSRPKLQRHSATPQQ